MKKSWVIFKQSRILSFRTHVRNLVFKSRSLALLGMTVGTLLLPAVVLGAVPEKVLTEKAITGKTSSEMLAEAKELFGKGDWDAAERAYWKALKTPRVEDRIPAYEGLSALYRKLKHRKKAERIEARLAADKEFMSKLVPESDSYYTAYTVQNGDTYAKLAASQGISLEWLQRANKRLSLRPGMTIRIPKIPFTIEVNKTTRTLTWKRGSEVMKVYSVAVGKTETETPVGTFKIISRVVDPVWYHMKQEIPPNSPENMLGPRWLGLDRKGYGIHGTTLPGSIGAKASHGCVRMHNYEVEELFNWIPLGTKVTISE